MPHRIPRLLLSLFGWMLVTLSASAQIDVTVRIASPMPRSLAAWSADPSLLQVTLRNTSQTSYDNLRLAFRVLGDSRGEVVRTVDSHPRMPRISLGPNETQVLYVDDISAAEALMYPSGLAVEIARDGIPEDRYQFCARVLDAATGNTEVGSTGLSCPRFTVFTPDPPSLIGPVAGEEVNPASLVFRWAFLDHPGARPAHFRLKIVPMFAGQNATAAMGANPALFDEVVMGTLYRYLPSDPDFSTRAANAVGWAWQVQALDDDEQPYGRNQGRSIVEMFKISTPPIANEEPVLLPPAQDQACNAGCTVPLPANRNVGAFTAASLVGQTIRIGKFDVKVTQATGSAGALNGEGEVVASFLRAPLRVALLNVKLNTDRVALDGLARALTDQPQLVPEAWLTRFDGSLGGNAAPTVHAIGDWVGDNRSRWVSAVSEAQPASLPLGLDRTIGSTRWTIALVGAEFTPTTAYVNAVLDVPMPLLDGHLALGAQRLCINPNGIGQPAQLRLLEEQVLTLRDAPGTDNDYTVRFAQDRGNNPGTAATWGCSGFESLSVAMTHELPRDVLVPVNDAGAPQPGKAEARFTFQTTSLNDWLIEGTLATRTMAPGVPDFVFGMTAISYDQSSTRNPAGLAFPDGYDGPVRGNAWTGLYIPSVQVQLPKALSNTNGGRVAASINGLIVDRMGLSFAANLTNLLDLSSNPGSLDGWAFSIQNLSLQVASSSLVSGTMAGQVNVPIGQAGLAYAAILSRPPEGQSGLRYGFTIQPQSTWRAELFDVATLRLDRTSVIEVGNQANGTLMASARLNGALTLEGRVGGVPVNLGGVRFEGFGLTSSPAQFLAGTWSKASPQHVVGGTDLAASQIAAAGGRADASSSSGFPVTIDEIGLATKMENGKPHAGLRTKLSVQLPASFGASTTLTVWGRLDTENGRYRPAFAGADLDQLCVNGDIGVVAIKEESCLTFYSQDVVYGDGFRGTLKADIAKLVSVDATVAFGNVGGYSYWYTDALAIVPSGVPIGSTPFSFFGFGGGVYYHMQQQNLPPTAALASGAAQRASYVPSPNVALGLKATVVLGTTQPTLFNADIGMEAAVREDGSLSFVAFTGDAYMLTGLTHRSNPPVYGNIGIRYDFAHERFDATSLLSVRLIPDVVEAQSEAQIYSGPDGWFLRIGGPEPPKRFNLKIAGFNLGSYLWVGDHTSAPEMPSVPPPAPQIGTSGRASVAQMTSGRAVMFGSQMSFHAGGRFLIFYGNIDAVAGFDLALKDFGSNAQCITQGGRTLNTIGANGWYATGQLYAGVQAAVGIEVDLFVFSGRVEIFNAYAGVTLQGGLPNPTWAKGMVEAGYSVLGGAVKGQMRYRFQAGEECSPLADSPLATLNLITDIKPGDNEQNVDVFAEPAMAFAFNLGEPVSLEDQNGRMRTFRLRTDGITLRRDNANGALVPGQRIPSDDGATVYFDPETMLDGRTWYWMTLTVRGEEKVGAQWQPAKTRAGQVITVTTSHRFRTGLPPDYIRPEHVTATYPADRQDHFLPNECRLGTVRLWENYSYLLNAPSPLRSYALIARFDASGGSDAPIDVPASFTNGGTSIAFNLPMLLPSTSYALQIVRRSNTTGAAGGFVEGNRLVFGGVQGDGSTLQQRTRELPGLRVGPGEKTMLLTYFRTSRFGTLREKMAGATVGAGTYDPTLGTLTAAVTLPEPFNAFDLAPPTKTDGARRSYTPPPLVRLSAAWNNAWVRSYADPKVYAYLGTDAHRYTDATAYAGGRSPYNGLLTDAQLMPPSPWMVATGTWASSASPSASATIPAATGGGSGSTAFPSATMYGTVRTYGSLTANVTVSSSTPLMPPFTIGSVEGGTAALDKQEAAEGLGRQLSNATRPGYPRPSASADAQRDLLLSTFQPPTSGPYPVSMSYAAPTCTLGSSATTITLTKPSALVMGTPVMFFNGSAPVQSVINR